jgi:pyrimidine operon attenuation protein/uracil phosphoribosyltransferase
MSEKRIQSGIQIDRALTRLSHEILERNGGVNDVVLVGMHSRGVPLANRIASTMRSVEDKEVYLGSLDISFFRDDISHKNTPLIKPTEIPTDITDKTVIIVDDVLYTGRSIRAAMDALNHLGRPRHIQLAVLVDRGHRELPIRADYVGKNLPTSKSENVQVRLKETDGIDEVVIINSERNSERLDSE